MPWPLQMASGSLGNGWLFSLGAAGEILGIDGCKLHWAQRYPPSHSAKLGPPRLLVRVSTKYVLWLLRVLLASCHRDVRKAAQHDIMQIRKPLHSPNMWLWIPLLTLTSCSDLQKSLNLSEPGFIICKLDLITPTLQGCCSQQFCILGAWHSHCSGNVMVLVYQTGTCITEPAPPNVSPFLYSHYARQHLGTWI